MTDRTSEDASTGRPLERRQLTIMFCDLVDSTRLAEQMDPEDFGALIEAHRTACSVPIKYYGGVVARYLGDGILVFFGYPEAHEDDPDRAVLAGLEIVAATEKLNQVWSGYGQGEIAVRIGIHTGIVVVGDVDKEDVRESMAVFGDVPALASRFQALAEPNTVALSEQTKRLLGPGITCVSRGKTTVKGASRPIAVFEAVAADTEAVADTDITGGPAAVPFINRQEELDRFEDCWSAARESRGQAVLLSGEPGIGKSRMIAAVQERLAAEPCLWLATRTSAYATNSDFFAFAELFHKVLRPARQGQFSATGYHLLLQVLKEQGVSNGKVALGFAALLGLEIPDSEPSVDTRPERLRELIFTAISSWLFARAVQTPVVLVVEDLHWADASTLEMIQSMLAELSTHPIMLILSSRDDSVISAEAAPLERIHVDRLRPDHAREMLQQVVSGAELPEVAVGTLLARAEGVPLFIEELPKPLLEPERPIGGATASLAPPDEGAIAIPATLRDSLMAQLDRMGRAKAVAQISAVLGHSFDFALLKRVWRSDEASLLAGVQELVDASLLLQRGTLPQAQLDFKHALIAETAYDSLLRQDRRRYHQLAAEALAAHFPTIADARPELLAHHYAAAGRGAAAYGAWLKAGQAAARRSANTEAIGHLRSAEAELAKLEKAGVEDLDDRWLALLKARGPVLIALSGWAAPEVEQTYRRILSLSDSMGVGHHDQFDAWAGLSNVHLVRGDLADAEAAAERMRELAIKLGDQELTLRWHRVLGLCDFLAARFVTAVEHHGEAIALEELPRQMRHTLLRGTNPNVIAYSIKAWSHWFLGNGTRASEASLAALETARRAGHPFSIGYALCLASSLAQCSGQAQEAQSRAEEALALSIEHSFPYWRAWANSVKGWALAAQGDPDGGLAVLQEGMAQYEATEATQMKSYNLCLLAATYQRAGRWQDSLATAEAAIAETKRKGIVFYQAEAYRLAAEAGFRLGDEAKALRFFLRALRIAAQQRALPLLVKVATSFLERSDDEKLRAAIADRIAQALTAMEASCSASELDAAKRRLSDIAAQGTPDKQC